MERFKAFMTYTSTIAMAVLFANVAFARDERPSIPPPNADHGEPRDVCDYKSRDWSAMRETLVAISRFRSKNKADVQEIARKALTGSRRYSIGEFELSYARWRSGSPPPNNEVCFAREATFSAIRNEGNEAGYECKATLDVKGTVLSISCELVAG